MKLFLNFCLLWLGLAVLSYAWGHVSHRRRIGIIKSILFGFYTAIAAVLVVSIVVYLF